MKAIAALFLISLFVACSQPSSESVSELPDTPSDSIIQQVESTDSPVSEDKKAAEYFTVSALSDTSSVDAVYTFPIFNSDYPHKPHEKINQAIQQAELELVIGEQDSSIFEKIWPAEDSYSGTTQFGFRIIRNSSTVLSIEIMKEGCGAYCEGYSTYYNFDSQTGESIDLNKLFTEEGLRQLASSVTQSRRNLLEENIKAHPAEEDEEMTQMYEQCLEYVTEDSFYSGAFFIDNGSVHFLRGRCSNHAMQDLDEIGDFDNAKSFAELDSYLNDYGKTLLN